jgi:hypothetical protein
MLYRRGLSLVVQGDAWFCVRWVLTRSGALHACMHFDQGVLGYLGTDRLFRARLTIGASPRDRDRQHWMGACSARSRESERVGSSTCYNLLKSGETIETYICNICL